MVVSKVDRERISPQLMTDLTYMTSLTYPLTDSFAICSPVFPNRLSLPW